MKTSMYKVKYGSTEILSSINIKKHEKPNKASDVQSDASHSQSRD